MTLCTSRPFATAESHLILYLQEIRKFPILAAETEYNLAKHYRNSGDIQAAHSLITSHLRLVIKIAISYQGYGFPLGEIISEGNIGLIQAVRRFDPDRGFRLATYAMWWIRAAIQEYILRSWSLVKIGTTEAQKKLFFNLRKLKGTVQAFDDGRLSTEHLASISKTLDVPESDVNQMNQRLSSRDCSLDTLIQLSSEKELHDLLVDETENQEVVLANLEEIDQRRALLAYAMQTLNARERHILTERRLRDIPATLEDLSQYYDISRERVRQIEMRAFEKLQKLIRLSLTSS